MAINRRVFLRRSAITAVGLGISSPLLGGIAFGGARRTAAGDKVVVTINLFGGNDGLNTVVPLDQYSRYSQLRPTIGIPREEALVLGNAPDFGLNPNMTALHALYGRGRVAVVNGVGLPPDAVGLFDHAASQYEFQSGDISNSSASTAPTGWLGRYLDSIEEGILSPAVDLVGGQVVLQGATRDALTIGSIEEFQIHPSGDTEALLAAYADIMRVPTGGGVAERNRAVRSAALEQSSIVRERTASYVPAVSYPEENYLAASLQQCAQLITSDLGVRALSVGSDGYDTHAAQEDPVSDTLGYHGYLLMTVSDAIGAFYADLEAHGAADRVLTVVFSEFGRRPEENSDAGTDHGYGSVAFVVGETVRGGVYGEYPSLAEDRLVLDGNVDVTTDVRSIYATILANHYGADPEPILDGEFPLLGFL